MGASFGTRLFTWLRGVEVGRDEFGNRYYHAKSKRGVHADSLRREKRWVIYNGEVEASRVPAEWHSWLHHTAVEPPPAEIARKSWQKPHQQNLTGTPLAYRPPGSLLQGGHRAPATGDYEAWKPE